MLWFGQTVYISYLPSWTKLLEKNSKVIVISEQLPPSGTVLVKVHRTFTYSGYLINTEWFHRFWVSGDVVGSRRPYWWEGSPGDCEGTWWWQIHQLVWNACHLLWAQVRQLGLQNKIEKVNFPRQEVKVLFLEQWGHRHCLLLSANDHISKKSST